MDNAERVRERRRLLRLNPTNYTAIARMGEYATRRGESDNERQEQGTGTKAQGYGQSTTVPKPVPVQRKNILPVEQKKVVKKQQGVDDTELINRLNKEKADESKQKAEPVRQQGNKKQRLRRKTERKPLTAEEKARRDARNEKVLSTVGTVAGSVVGATFVGKLGKGAQRFAKTPRGKKLLKQGKSAFKKGLARFTKAYKKRFPQSDLAKKQPRDARGRPKATTTEKTTTKKTTTKTTQSKTDAEKLAESEGKRKVLGRELRKSRLESGAVKKRLGKAISMFKRGQLVVRKNVGKTVEKVGKKIQPRIIKTGARTGPPKKSNNRLRQEERKRKLDKFIDSKNPKTEKDRTYDKAVKGQVDSKQLRSLLIAKFRSLVGPKGKINLTNADRLESNRLREEILKQTRNKIISESASRGLVRAFGKELKKILDKYDKKN